MTKHAPGPFKRFTGHWNKVQMRFNSSSSLRVIMNDNRRAWAVSETREKFWICALSAMRNRLFRVGIPDQDRGKDIDNLEYRNSQEYIGDLNDSITSRN